MKAANAKARLQAKTSTPKPLRQGQLDCLCGLYAIVNACKIAYASLGIKGNLDRWQLMTFLIEDLEQRQKLAEVFCYGMSPREHAISLKVAQKYLLGKHGLQLIVTKPFAKANPVNSKKVFKVVSDHLMLPGTSALLDFETPQIEHWTVIHRVKGEEVHFADSTGMRPRPIQAFSLKSERVKADEYTITFARNGLLLLTCMAVI